MQDSTNNFEIELDGLLKLYLGKDELNRLNLKISPSKIESNKISEMINDFYSESIRNKY